MLKTAKTKTLAPMPSKRPGKTPIVSKSATVRKTEALDGVRTRYNKAAPPKPENPRSRKHDEDTALDRRVADNLAALRAKLGLTHAAMAEKAGVYRLTWMNWEVSGTGMHLSTAVRVAKNLGVKLDELLA